MAPAYSDNREGISSLEIDTSFVKNVASKGKGFVKMLIPTSPEIKHLALHQDDDDLNDESHDISDNNFEFEGEFDEEDYDGTVDAHGMMTQGTATSAQVAVNIFISFVGAGLLGMPYAFSRSGWLLGTISLAMVSTGNLYCMLLLVKIRKRLEANGHTGIKGYGCVGREVIGPKCEIFVNICLVISQAGFATAYLIFIAANVQSATNGEAGRAMIIFGCVPILSVLVQFRDMKKLSPFSLIADGELLFQIEHTAFNPSQLTSYLTLDAFQQPTYWVYLLSSSKTLNSTLTITELLLLISWV
jgi:hypothetical protein